MLISDRLAKLLGKSLGRTEHYTLEQDSSKEKGEGPGHGVRSSLP